MEKKEQPAKETKTKKDNVKLSNRTDEAAAISKDVVSTMIEKIFELKKIRKSTIRARDREIEDLHKKEIEIRSKHEGDINRIEKDIYKFENAIKQICGTTEFYSRIAQHKADLKTKNKETTDD